MKVEQNWKWPPEVETEHNGEEKKKIKWKKWKFTKKKWSPEVDTEHNGRGDKNCECERKSGRGMGRERKSKIEDESEYLWWR